MNGATLEEIFSRIEQLHLNLCPLRFPSWLNYFNQQEEAETGKTRHPVDNDIFKIENKQDEEVPVRKLMADYG